ncbi:hypothetical protein ACGFOU_17055 [Streptomyces sp. NPDC048595]|uniref:hypothetical protein n=1 Tax=Streptomyces sp. NPDC048595 TaxID=3365576 RepID=UPI0037127182
MAEGQRESGDGPARAPRGAAELKQSRVWGVVLQSVGVVAISLGTASGALAYRSMRTWRAEQGWTAVAVEWALMAALLAGGRRALRHGSRHRAPVLPTLAELPEDEGTVLFLRSFEDDEGFARVQRGPVREGPWAADTDTEEQQLREAVAPFGTMVALGRPKDRLPQVGAGRHYSPDEGWQAQVLAALERAALVLLACGPGPNLRWEVEQVVARDQPERLVLIVVRDAVQYASFREAMQDVFPKGLPSLEAEREGGGRPTDMVDGPDTYIKDAIWFDADWTPHLAPLGAEDPEVEVIWLIDHMAWVRSAFPLAIRPVFRRAGLDPPGLPPGRLSRPRALKVAVPLIGLAWAGFFAATTAGGTNGLPTLLLFGGLPMSILLLRTWFGGQIAMGFVKIFSGIFAMVLCLAPLLPSASHPDLGLLPLGLALAAGVLLLSRQDVRRWKASGAYRTGSAR